MPRWPKRKVRPGVDEYGRTALWYSALDGDLERVQRELAAGAKPSAGDDVGYTPLHAAVQEGHVEVVRALLDAGADANTLDSHGNGPLWVALLSAPLNKKVVLADFLLAAGAKPQQANRHGRNPHDIAMEMGHGMEEPFLRQNQVGAVEDFLAEITAIPDAADSFSLWVPDRVSHRGQVITQDLAMAVVLDELLARKFFPDGFQPGNGGRLYRYRREK